MRIIVTILILLICSHTLAHTDRLIEIDGDGNLIGLPTEYLPAIFNRKEMVLNVQGSTLNVRSCLPNNVDFGDVNVKITSSWYHSRSTLPPYINLSITPDRGDEYRLLFELESLNPISFKKAIRNGKTSITYHQFKVHEACTSQRERALPY